MRDFDISIFDTKSNTIENVGTNTFKLESNNNNFAMSRCGQVKLREEKLMPGQVVALVFDWTNDRIKAVSFTYGKKTVREVKDYGNIFD